jgi:hypothetical protein
LQLQTQEHIHLSCPSGPRLVKYIDTNRTIEGNWYFAVWSNIPRPYALWLYCKKRRKRQERRNEEKRREEERREEKRREVKKKKHVKNSSPFLSCPPHLLIVSLSVQLCVPIAVMKTPASQLVHEKDSATVKISFTLSTALWMSTHGSNGESLWHCLVLLC